jgi:hypothetical protein
MADAKKKDIQTYIFVMGTEIDYVTHYCCGLTCFECKSEEKFGKIISFGCFFGFLGIVLVEARSPRSMKII